jgi:hypothetical protein
VGGGDAEVDAVRAIVDVEERQRCNRGRRGGNGRVDAEVDAVKPPKRRGEAGFARSSNASGTKARDGVANTRRTKGEGPNREVVLDEEEAMREMTHRRVGLSDNVMRQPDRRVGLSDGAGRGSSTTKTQSARRRPCADG